ncbi:hypothetical protein HK102_003479 [Quaeritorhiza haematococci]|nr:hypothetical protein HK102_003479 [Quaeritorhiza haematococci]
MRLVLLLLSCGLYLHTFVSGARPIIRGYGFDGKVLFSSPPNGLFNYVPWDQVKYMEMGNGSIVDFWVPWTYGAVMDPLPFVFASGVADVVEETKDLKVRIFLRGWGSVADEPICNGTDNPALPCPDLIVLGTTQVASRFYKGELEPLDQYFSDYTEETGLVVVDDFYKTTYYDYKIEGSWVGVPLTSDLLALYYNKTLFQSLGLNPPPPAGNWPVPTGLSWNWDRFLEYVAVLKKSGKSPGFRIMSSFNDEIGMIMSTLARFANVVLVNANGTCGLRNQRWYDAMEKYIRQPLKAGLGTYGIDFANLKRNNATAALKFLDDKDPNSDVMSQLNALEQLRYTGFAECPDFNGIGMAPIGCIYGYLWAKKDLGYGFPPGHFTFLGGAGMSIPKYAKNKQIGWKVIARFINQTTNYVGRMNTQGAPPPFMSFSEWETYKGEFYTFAKKLLKRAVPVQYPSTPYTNWQGLEKYMPFRMLMLEMLNKNFTAEVATERVCQVIDYLFGRTSLYGSQARHGTLLLKRIRVLYMSSATARDCVETDYEMQISECYPNNTKTLSYVWKTPSTCKMGTIALPPPIQNIECAYVVSTSPEALGMSAVAALGALASTIYSIGFFWYRRRAAIKSASIEFCLIIFLGSILMYAFVFLQAGPPSKPFCIARPWFLAFGFGTFFGGFLVKTMRIDMIFSSNRSGKNIDVKHLSLLSMFQKLTIIVLFEFVPLVALSVVGTPGVEEMIVTLRGLGSYTQQECQPFNQVPVVILLTINAFLIVYGSYIAWRSRNVPDAFNESRFVMVAVLLISFTAVVIIPVTLVLTNARTLYLLQALAINFATTISVGIFAIPKLWAAYKNITPRTSSFNVGAMNSNSSGGSNGPKSPNYKRSSTNRSSIQVSNKPFSLKQLIPA